MKICLCLTGTQDSSIRPRNLRVSLCDECGLHNAATSHHSHSTTSQHRHSKTLPQYTIATSHHRHHHLLLFLLWLEKRFYFDVFFSSSSLGVEMGECQKGHKRQYLVQQISVFKMCSKCNLLLSQTQASQAASK